jgi:hypothetical protein
MIWNAFLIAFYIQCVDWTLVVVWGREKRKVGIGCLPRKQSVSPLGGLFRTKPKSSPTFPFFFFFFSTTHVRSGRRGKARKEAKQPSKRTPMLCFKTTLCVAIVTLVAVDGFLVMPGIGVGVVHSTTRLSTAQALSSDQDWVLLADGVKKRVIEQGEGNIAKEKSAVKVEYTGTLLGEQDWTVQDVVDCWLSNQQGLDHLKDAFMERQIDGSKLMDASFFTEEFVTNELQVFNKIQCKKLVMASRRLAKQQDKYPIGTEFDSSKERGPFQFTLGEGKVIRACEMAVATMKEGERALVVCRADYAYGSEGFRKQNGHVVVPPFSSLCFDMTLLKC